MVMVIAKVRAKVRVRVGVRVSVGVMVGTEQAKYVRCNLPRLVTHYLHYSSSGYILSGIY